jgi:hypothetical protein
VLLPPWVRRADRFYRNNLGAATIDITPVAAPPD